MYIVVTIMASLITSITISTTTIQLVFVSRCLNIFVADTGSMERGSQKDFKGAVNPLTH